MGTLLTSEVFIFCDVSTEEFGVTVVLSTPAGPVTDDAAPEAPVGPVTDEAAPEAPVGPVTVDAAPEGPVGPVDAAPVGPWLP